MITKVVLIRHGVTKWNKQKRYCGFLDVGLSAEGKRQAEKLHQRLKNEKFEKIYCSDLKRALQTARIVFKGKKIIKEKDLKEINFGVIEGMSYDEIMQKYPQVYSNWVKDPYKHKIPKSETMLQFKKRINKAIKKIVMLNKGKTVAVVCHGGTISMYITTIFKNNKFWHHIPGSVSVSVVEYEKLKPQVKLFNCTKHLEIGKSK